MAIDTIIDYPCVPKDTLTTAGILARLKARDRAEAVIKIYRDNEDWRPPDEIGFEITRRAADGTETTETVIAADALSQAEQLNDLAPYCTGCPANRSHQPFGCIGAVNFPISEAAEIWQLKQLPPPASPLIYILKRGVETYGYDGETARQLRSQESPFFESEESLGRPYVDSDFVVTTDMLFEMMFMVGPIQPGHAIMLLLFLGVVPRDRLSADELFWLVQGNSVAGDPQSVANSLPLQLVYADEEDASITDLKHFLHALYLAFMLNVALIADL